MSSEFCLRWNNHRPNLVSVFKELLQHEVLVDVTLAAEGQFIHAHKLVLSACSLYFKELFAGNPCQHPIVILKDFRLADLKTVVDFIYQGEVNVKQERLPHVLKAAESLRIKGLAENPHSFEEFQPGVASSQHNAPGTPRLGSQASSLQQSSSLSDSREQSLSLEGEEGDNNGPAAPHSPPTKRRRLGHYDDHDNTQHDGSSDGVRVKEEPCGGGGASASGDERHGTVEDGHQGYRGRDPSMLLLPGGGISPGERGGGGGVGECSSPVPPDPTTGGSSPTPPPSLPATPSLSINNATTNNGDSNSSSGGGGAGAALTPPDSAALLPHPNAGRNRRAVLQRQLGIIRDGTHTHACPTTSFTSPEKRLTKEDLRRTEESHQEQLQTTQYSEYILPSSLSVTTVPSGSSFGGESDSVFGSTETIVSSSISYSEANQDIPTYGFSGTSLLPVPAVFIAAPRDSGGSSSSSGPGPLTKQVSQPELSDNRSVVHQYAQHPTITRSLGSIGSSGSLGAQSASGYMQGSAGSSGGQQLQVVQMYVKQPQHSSRSSTTGSPASSITCVASGQSPINLRPIQPKPSHEEGQRSGIKEDQGLYHRKDQGPPLIRLTPSDDITPLGPQPPRVSRAISEEPLASRGSTELLGPGPAPLTQSVSEDTGLDGGGLSRLLPPSAASQQHQSSSSSGPFSTSHLRYSSLSTVPPTSGHRLALREGPALGCNFCWNSTDDLGRIQRRKTKYHCPECRTNLCIVPCYQKYHMQMERSDDTDKQITKILTKTSSV